MYPCPNYNFKCIKIFLDMEVYMDKVIPQIATFKMLVKYACIPIYSIKSGQKMNNLDKRESKTVENLKY